MPPSDRQRLAEHVVLQLVIGRFVAAGQGGRGRGQVQHGGGGDAQRRPPAQEREDAGGGGDRRAGPRRRQPAHLLEVQYHERGRAATDHGQHVGGGRRIARPTASGTRVCRPSIASG